MATGTPAERTRAVLIKCANVLAAHVEVPGVVACRSLLQLPDHYASHTYATLPMQTMLATLHLSAHDPQVPDDELNETVTLQRAHDDTIVFVNAATDYLHRPLELDNVCWYEYVSMYVKERNHPVDDDDGANVHEHNHPRASPVYQLQAQHPQRQSHHIRQLRQRHIPCLTILAPSQDTVSENWAKVMLVLSLAS